MRDTSIPHEKIKKRRINPSFPKISISNEITTAKTENVIIEVEDTGIGITEDKLGRIWCATGGGGVAYFEKNKFNYEKLNIFIFLSEMKPSSDRF